MYMYACIIIFIYVYMSVCVLAAVVHLYEGPGQRYGRRVSRHTPGLPCRPWPALRPYVGVSKNWGQDCHVELAFV